MPRGYLTIYRVECAERRTGVYYTTSVLDGTAAEHRPGPYEDGLGDKLWGDLPWEEQRQYYFGFRSVDALQRWFDCAQERRRCVEEVPTLRVNVYQVPASHVLTGSAQAVFKLDHAKCVGALCFETLYPVPLDKWN